MQILWYLMLAITRHTYANPVVTCIQMHNFALHRDKCCAERHLFATALTS